MPITLPNLDDRRYADLLEEALAIIPVQSPEWTNHNPSDPGITLIELFAYLTEISVYRLNRVTPANLLSFLKLLNGSEWQPLGKSPDSLTPEEILQQVPLTIRNLRKLERAVTCHDFETLALEASPEVARAHCLPRLNLEAEESGRAHEKEGHITLIVLPSENTKAAITDIVSDVSGYLAPKLLLTTRLHVTGPRYVDLKIEAEVVLKSDRKAETIQGKIVEELKQFFSPYPNTDRNSPGWPFGRNVFVSEVFALLDQLPFIDYVKTVNLAAGSGAPVQADIELKSYQLVRLEQQNVTVRIS